MTANDFYGSEVATTVAAPTNARIEFVGKDGAVTVLKAKIAAPGRRDHRLLGDERQGAGRLLRGADRGRQEGRHPVLAARQDDHDEDLRSHPVRPLRVGVLLRRVREAWRHAEKAGRRSRHRRRRDAGQDRDSAGGREGGDQGRHPGRVREAARPRHGQFRQGHHQFACAERRDHRRIDAGDDPRVRQDVGCRRQAARRHRRDPRPLLLDAVPGRHRRLQGARRVRSEDDGHRAERRPDGAGRPRNTARTTRPSASPRTARSMWSPRTARS